MRRIFIAALLVATAVPAIALQPRNPQIDYAGFQRLTREVQPIRQQNLVDWAAFQRLAAEPDMLILDARSADAYARGHIAGAVNLPFTDFTAESLARVIGASRNRPILIYCNNNFSNNADPVPRKLVQVALNIQTFINLHVYGYRNVRELNEVIDYNEIGAAWVRPPALASAAG